MVAQKTLLLNPIGDVEPLDYGLAPRLPDLNGKVLGLIDNAKPNSNVLVDKLEKVLTERYSFARIFRTRKRKSSGPAHEMAELEKCDLVIGGIAL